jgi:tetratricopeptide (TPR) repeat protein
VLLLVAFVAVAAHLGEGRRFADLLRRAQPAWLGAAAVLQVATYLCAAAVWQRALRCNGGVRRSVRSLVPLGLAKLFADQALPSAGMSGTLLVVRGLLRRGVPRGLAIVAMLADLVSWYAAYALVGVAALAILWYRGELTGVLVAVGVAFLLLATGVPLAIFGLRDRERSLPRWAQRLPWANEVLAAIADAQAGAIFGGTLAVPRQNSIRAFESLAVPGGDKKCHLPHMGPWTAREFSGPTGQIGAHQDDDGHRYQQVREAIKKFEHATELDPTAAPAWGGWGAALADLHQPEETMKKFEHATELDPKAAYALWLHCAHGNENCETLPRPVR